MSARRTGEPKTEDQPGTARRAILAAGGVAGLIAMAGTTLGQAEPAYALPTASITDWLNVISGYAATGNTVTLNNAAMTSGSAALTASGASFTSGDVGKVACVAGAGTSGATLVTTISGYTSSTHVTLAASASTTVSSAQAIYGTDDTTAINNALTAAGNLPTGGVVYLPAGSYLVSAPLLVPGEVTLQGWSNSGELALSGAGQNHSILIASGGWSPGSYTSPGVVFFNGPTSGGLYAPAVKNLYVNCSMAPSGVHGVGSCNNVLHAVIDRVDIAFPTGVGINGPNNTGVNPAANPSGWHVTNCMIEQPVSHGVLITGGDSTFINVHAQNGKQAASGDGDGFVISGTDMKLIGCRADSCQNGFTVHSIAGGSEANGYFLSSVILAGCTTQSNNQNGLYVDNTSGTKLSNPVIATGCSFEGDGTNGTSGGGGYAGIAVAGCNIVILNACDVVVNTENVYPGGCPEYALATATVSGGSPQYIHATGGFWNSTSTTVINDAAGSGAAGVLVCDVGAVGGGYPSNTSAVAPLGRSVFPCPPVSYAPASQTNLTVSSTTMAAFSSANVNTGSFLAPPSGSVIVTVSFSCFASAGGAFVALGLAAHGTVSPIVCNEVVTKQGASSIPQTVQFAVTSLTPSASYNFDLVGCITTGDTFTIQAIGTTSTTPTLSNAGTGAPVTLTVQAV